MKSSIVVSIGLIALSHGDASHAIQATDSNWKIGQMVQTDSGPVYGHAASTAPQVSEYLGIPFAQPPIGDLRFAPPRRYSGSATVNRTAFVSPSLVCYDCRLTAAIQGFSCPIASTYTSQLLPSPSAGLNFSAAGTQIMDAIAQVGDRFSEDCLTLNIWTKPQVGERKKAVLLWIYGGGFVAGNSDAPTYNGAHIADEEDVVVVSIKYEFFSQIEQREN